MGAPRGTVGPPSSWPPSPDPWGPHQAGDTLPLLVIISYFSLWEGRQGSAGWEVNFNADICTSLGCTHQEDTES